MSNPLSLYSWSTQVDSRYPTKVSVVARSKKEAQLLLVQGLRTYRSGLKHIEQVNPYPVCDTKNPQDWVSDGGQTGWSCGRTTDQYQEKVKRYDEEAKRLYRETVTHPTSGQATVAWEGPYSSRLDGVLECEHGDSDNQKSFEEFIRSVEPEIFPIRVGLVIGATALDG